MTVMLRCQIEGPRVVTVARPIDEHKLLFSNSSRLSAWDE